MPYRYLISLYTQKVKWNNFSNIQLKIIKKRNIKLNKKI
jgi:hypothetical protein